jgi:hypothetical protein
MNLNGPIYLQERGFLTTTKNKILDIGPQNVLFVREDQIREFLRRQGVNSTNEKVDSIIKRLVYFSTPRPDERTMLLSEITDLTNIEYNSVDVCPGLKTTILDLNFDSAPDWMLQHYDVIFNFGTTEHIFNQWNSFEFMHDTLSVNGVMYHQLPASGYLDHGYYCYTPLFFREMAQANDYVIEKLAVTPAGESKIDALGIPGLAGDSLLSPEAHLEENNRVPALNIHVILRKTKDTPFRASLEIATAHSQVNTGMLDRYTKLSHGAGAIPRQRLIADLGAAQSELAAIRASRSWRMTAPLRGISTLLYGMVRR